MLRIGFDREIFLHQQYGGVSRGFASIISEFKNDSHHQIEPVLLFSRTNNYYIKEQYPHLGPARNFIKASSGWSTLATYGPVREVSSLWAGGKSSRKPLDILHATYYRPNLRDRISAAALAVTVHDFIPEYLGWSGFRNPHIGKSSLLRKAELIVCVSEATRMEALDTYKLDSNRIRVIHQGVHSVKEISAKSTINANPYLLYVGHRTGYKNFDLLLQAFRILNSKSDKYRLVVVGPKLTKLESGELDRQVGEGYWKALQPQSDRDLARLYRNAFLHVVTSGMEGFGMTILESMAQGTPVIMNDIPVFREVAGVAGTYFPSSADSLVEAIKSLGDSSNHLMMSQLSISRAAQFSWEKAASLHAAAYQELCD